MVHDQATSSFFRCPDLQELYSRKYDDKMTHWRAICAIDKASNIAFMLAGMSSSIEHVLEVGCGTGAVLEELAARKVGTSFTGIEIGTERTHNQQRDDLHIHAYDGHKIPYDDRSFDLVYATHVLEHVTDERGFLCELRRVSRRFVYIEVPCELHLRTTRRALQQSLDIGHINAYTPESFALQLETSGLIVKNLKLFDQPYSIHRFHSPVWQAIVKTVTRKGLLSLNQSIASRIFTYHCGALCEQAPLLSI
jgi:SAM-dependent methyltransferase